MKILTKDFFGALKGIGSFTEEDELKGQFTKKRESRNLEFKESLSCRDEIGESVSAFSNFIKQNTDNHVYPNVKLERVDNKDILIIEINESEEKPVFFKGIAYIRVGKSNHKLSASEIRRIAKESSKSYWDGQICEGASLSDIDLDFFNKEFIILYEKLTEKKIEGELKELLLSFGCFKDKKPTNAGILLFGKNPQKFFMNAYIALARYKGDVEGSERLDYKEFTGNLFLQIDKCNSYIKEHMAIMSSLKPGEVRREDIPEYGVFSVRELITNAVCHRDYSMQGSKVIIKMFDNRIDYYNPGGLVRDITPKNILQKQYSRNPIIAKVLSKVRYIEEVGEGWNKIIREHKEHALKPKLPKIIADKSSFYVSLFSSKGKFKEGKDTEKYPEKYPERMNPTQQKIIDIIKKNPNISREEIASQLNLSLEAIKKNVFILKKKGILKRIGPDKGGYWGVVESK